VHYSPSVVPFDEPTLYFCIAIMPEFVPFVDPALYISDKIVLESLLCHDSDNQSAIDSLSALNDPASKDFQTTIFTSWDSTEVPLIKAYSRWAQTVVRNPMDVVFLTHTILYMATSMPSAAFLFYHFTYLHAVLHLLMTAFYCGPFTLLLHNHIHNNGVLSKEWATFDYYFPLILEPLMGHTWNSYYYHHVKHHHNEGNGPEDLSSTVRYQRDELSHFLMYVGRFMFLVWIELPLYFVRRNRRDMALTVLVTEVGNYTLYAALFVYAPKPTTFVFLLPLLVMRIFMMVGNWGQHAFVDDVDPESDFRSSITLIDVPSNRYCFNDGWHTSHHLNSRRHWRDHPLAFMKEKDKYVDGRALVFRNIDYLEITYRLFRHDYMHLAKCLVPLGEQQKLSLEEIASLLRTKTRRFTEDDIRRKWKKAQ